jgi:hypothetical protein
MLFLMGGFIVCVLGLLSACDVLNPSAEKTEPVDAQALVDALVYVKAKNGLCFGVGTTSRISTGGSATYSNHVVNVLCEDVGL